MPTLTCSTVFPLRDAAFELLGSPGTGRLVRYNLRTGETAVLVENLSFANGLELDPAERFLLFCESGTARLHKYHLTGER